MTILTDRSIAVLRRLHDDLTARVAAYDDADLERRSGASEWPVHQVLSHLGSSSEITWTGCRAAIQGAEPPGPGFNPSVWDRWNALGAREHAAAYVESAATLVELLESLPAQQRDELRVQSFLPDPLPLETIVGLRLSEVAQHHWDISVAFDAGATLDAEAAELLLEHLAGGLGFLVGFWGKPGAVREPAVVAISGSALAIAIGDTAALVTDPPEPTATFTGAPEAVVRLLGGRLTPGRTPAAVTVSGNVTLEELRAVFPGF